MIVIARNNGPIYKNPDGSSEERRGLIQGKSYQVVEWAKHNGNNWVKQSSNLVNPKEAKYFIKVINEWGQAHDYWNDYFLSDEEMKTLIRDNKLNQILK
jgi:hypothetical protein